jgi:hypothetical protein
LTAAVDCAISSLGNDEFSTTLGTNIPFTQLVCHVNSPF